MYPRRLLCLLSGLVFFGTSAVAATISNEIVLSNGSGATPGCGGGFLVEQGGVGTVSDFAPYSQGNCTVELAGYAGGGVVGILGDLGANLGSQSIMQATARAVSNIGNIFIRPKGDETVESLLEKWGSTISITLNAELSASLQSAISSDRPFSRRAGAGLDTVVRFFTSGGMQQDIDSYSVAVTNTPGETLDLALITRSINLTSTHDWQKPLGVNFSLQGRVGTSSYGDSIASAEFDAINSLGFASDGPVFDVPDGFTVFAPELNIIDNRWTDPRTVVAPSAVPLPAGLPLLLVGVGALALIRRRA